MIRINNYTQKKGRFISKIKQIFLLLIVGIAALWSFFWLPYFRINEVEINDPLVNKREVEEKLGLSLSSLNKLFLPKNNFFLFPSNVAQKAILESGLGVADIEKKFPNKISVNFIEIKPKFLYCEQKICFFVDKDGVPHETAPFFSDSPLPILEIDGAEAKLGKGLLVKSEANFLLEFQQEIKKFGLEIKKIEINKDIKLTINDGWQLILILGEEKEPKSIAQKLFLIFERKIKDSSRLEYIDMRFPNKAFYKLK